MVLPDQVAKVTSDAVSDRFRSCSMAASEGMLCNWSGSKIRGIVRFTVRLPPSPELLARAAPGRGAR